MRSLSLFILGLIFFFFSVLPVNACLPKIGPDPWYSTKIEINKSNLPQGVKIIDNNSEFPDLTNKSSTPIYIVSENTSEKTYPNSEIPSSYIPKFKLVSNKVYGFFSYNQDQPEAWSELDYWKGVNIRVDADMKLEGKSKQINEHDRPGDVKIPTPQNLSFLTYYQGQPLIIRGKMIYSLNEYCGKDPCNQGYTRNSSVSDFLLTTGYLIGIVGSFVGAIVSSIVIVCFRKRMNSKTISRWNTLFKWSAVIFVMFVVLYFAIQIISNFFGSDISNL